MKIASDDTASTVSTSWGEREPDEGAGAAQGENIAFTQMAMQGQSIFAAAGDDGAFDCLGYGTSNSDKVAVDDPGSQPWVTSAGRGPRSRATTRATIRPRATRRASKASGTRSTTATTRSKA
jgi:subtilase family serine protease